jgi:hypothetical protein
MRWQKESFFITDDINSLDIIFFVNSLLTTYWGAKRTSKTIKKPLDKSTVLSLFDGKKQIGFARIIGDDATFAYVCGIYTSRL